MKVIEPYHMSQRKLAANLYRPAPSAYASKAITLHNWPLIGTDKIQDDLFANMAKTYRNNNVGHVFGPASPLIAIDWDCIESSTTGCSLAVEHLGHTPLVRQGRPGTWAALYQMDRKYSPKNQRFGRWETFSSSGFLVFGPNHPNGFEYKWLFELPTDVPVWELPTITGEQLQRFNAACKKAIPPREVSKHTLPGNLPRSMADQVTEYDLELISRLSEERKGKRASQYGEIIKRQLHQMEPGSRHYTMISVVSSLVTNGFDDDAIFHLLSDPYIRRFAGDGTDREGKVKAAILGARVKFGGLEPRHWETSAA